MTALETVSRDHDVARFAVSRQNVSRLWDVCQIPTIARSRRRPRRAGGHALQVPDGPEERIPAGLVRQQVALADRTDGDIDTLSNRIAHIRTWTFVSNRSIGSPTTSTGRAAPGPSRTACRMRLHEQLTQRFVDRRTSALMRG
jgi:ATP-dependent RNA helicase SUPV3L1/SUV3